MCSGSLHRETEERLGPLLLWYTQKQELEALCHKEDIILIVAKQRGMMSFV